MAIVQSDIVLADGTIYQVESSETVNNATINSGGTMHVSSGGTAKNATVNSDGLLDVSSGGTANSTTVNDGGSLHVFSGGTANSVIVNSNGLLEVYWSGTATEIIENGGYVSVEDGTNVMFASNMFSGLVLSSYAVATIHSGTTATDTTVNTGGELYVFSGGLANNTKVNSGGQLTITSGGTAMNIVWTPCEGQFFVDDGASVSFASEYSGVYFGSDKKLLSNAAVMESMLLTKYHEMYVMSGGTGNITTVNRGRIIVDSGGTANSTTVNYEGRLYVSSGGTANSTMLNSRGSMYIYSGGTADNTTVNSSGSMYIYSGGTANNTTVNSGGRLTISSGCTATEIIENGGYVYIDDDAEVTFTPHTIKDLYAYNGATIHSGTTVCNANVEGELTIYSGGKLTGKVTGFRGIRVSSGAIVDFNLTSTSPGAAAYIENIRIISGTPTYTITVNADQTEGIYTLAEGASSFKQTITVVNTTGVELGVLTVGETVPISGVDYTLSLSEKGLLSLKVGETDTPSPYTGDGLILRGGESELPNREKYSMIHSSLRPDLCTFPAVARRTTRQSFTAANSMSPAAARQTTP